MGRLHEAPCLPPHRAVFYPLITRHSLLLSPCATPLRASTAAVHSLHWRGPHHRPWRSAQRRRPPRYSSRTRPKTTPPPCAYNTLEKHLYSGALHDLSRRNFPFYELQLPMNTRECRHSFYETFGPAKRQAGTSPAGYSPDGGPTIDGGGRRVFSLPSADRGWVEPASGARGFKAKHFGQVCSQMQFGNEGGAGVLT